MNPDRDVHPSKDRTKSTWAATHPARSDHQYSLADRVRRPKLRTSTSDVQLAASEAHHLCTVIFAHVEPTVTASFATLFDGNRGYAEMALRVPKKIRIGAASPAISHILRNSSRVKEI